MSMTMPIYVNNNVCGIPCIIRVISWEKYVPDNVYGPAESWYPAEGGFGEWEVLNQHGRPAPWLERMLTEAERDRIDYMLFELIERGGE